MKFFFYDFQELISADVYLLTVSENFNAAIIFSNRAICILVDIVY